MERRRNTGRDVSATTTVTVVVLLAFLSAAGVASAKKVPSYPGPSWGPSMVYDAKDGYVLMFGGSSHQNQTWEFSDGKWTDLDLLTAPPARSYAGMAYDAADGYVVLFGGRCGTCDDTWEFSAGHWTNVTASAGRAPSPRESMGMAYDAKDGYVVLFGGSHHNHAYNDTWEFVHGKWSNVTGTTGGNPPKRAGQGMAYDATDGYVLMYGGQTSPAHLLNDTWEFSGGRWTLVASENNPGPKWWPGMTFDSSDGCILLFGGIINVAKQWWTTPPDTWTYVGGIWTNVTDPSNSPPQRFGEGLVDDPPANDVVMFGGLNSTAVVAHAWADTWTYQEKVWTNIARPA